MALKYPNLQVFDAALTEAVEAEQEAVYERLGVPRPPRPTNLAAAPATATPPVPPPPPSSPILSDAATSASAAGDKKQPPSTAS